MKITIELNSEKCALFNQRSEEISTQIDVDYTPITTLEQVFLSYADALDDETFEGKTVVQKDYRSDFESVYICGLNDKYKLGAITDYDYAKAYYSPIYFSDYGVADNASQVLDYFDDLCHEHAEYMENHKFIILMTPIFKDSTKPFSGWRWHKWGRYIGKFDHRCEYLNDEVGIDYVYVFKILEVQKS